MSREFSGATAVAGLGVLQFKRGGAPWPEQETLVRAIVAACADAGIDPGAIDGFASYGDDHNEPTRLMAELGTRELRWSSAIWGGGGGGIAGALAEAAAAIITGQAEIVAVYRALVQSSSGRLSAAVSAHFLNHHHLAAGMLAPAQFCAMRARRMFEYYGVPETTAQAVVRADYHHAARNPAAVAYNNHFTMEDYHASRWIAEPFRLLDCSRENDGAGVLILTSAERARDLRQKPVYLLGAAIGAEQGGGDMLENNEDYTTAGFRGVARRLWAQTGLTPADIDVAQIYENFSAQAVASIIDHGFCTHDSAGAFISFENLIAPTGKLPINTAGGNIAQGFIHGIGMPIEAVRQLRGQSSNPVPGARTCLLAGGPVAPLVSSAVFGTEPSFG